MSAAQQPSPNGPSPTPEHAELPMSRRERFRDSYDHYRRVLAKPRVVALWRAIAYEVLRWPDGVRPSTWEKWHGQ